MAKGNMFIEHKVMACAISIVIALAGFICIKTLPIEQYPDIAPPTVFVYTTYTGADASTIMNSVIMPLEEAINGVQDMTYMSSSASSNGSAEITVFFKQGTDSDMATVNVQNRISKATSQLPAEVLAYGITVEKRQNSTLQISALYSPDDKFDKDFISNYVDINVKPRIMRVNGVGGVMNFGNTYSLRIWMNPEVMGNYNLVPADIIAAVSSQNIVAAAGSLGERSENAYEFKMEYKGRLKDIEEFEDIVIRATNDGHILHLRDVAEVELGSLSYTLASSVDNHPGVAFLIYQSAGANASKVNADLTKLYRSLEKQLPPGLEFKTLLTSDDFLYAAIHNVIETLIIAIILVILVVYFFLQNFKATLIPSISVIVSLLGTFAVVKIAGFSLNILTLFALVLAIGTVVDDSIVVVEAVMAKLESGYTSAHKATRAALSEVTAAVFSCTLVFMAVFIPVTFMPGTSGTFFTQFGVTIAASVGLSCINALTLCPALCAVLMRPSGNEGEKKNLNYYTKLAYNASYKAIYEKYVKAVSSYIKHSRVSWILLGAALVLLVVLLRALPTGLVPQEDQGVMLVDIAAPEGSTLHETQQIMAKAEARIKDIPEVESSSAIYGYGLISGNGSNFGSLIVRLKNWDDRKGRKHSIYSVMDRFAASCEDIKEAVIVPFQQPQIPGYGNSTCMELILEDTHGGDMTEFSDITNEFLAKLRERPEVQMAISTYSEKYPRYIVDVNATQCDRAGVSPSEVLNVLGAFCGGALCGNYNQYGKVYRVMVAAAPEYRLDPNALSNIFIRVGDKMAPISQFVTLKPGTGSATLRRFNLFQSITCQVVPGDGCSTGDVQKTIEEVSKEYLPAGYTYEYGGMSRELAENAKSNLTIYIYLICIVLIYLILGCLYESWLIPLAVLFSVPFGLMGSFLFSAILGLENNIYLQTGVIMLIGLLAKTAILITEFAVEKHKQGMPVMEAAIGACKDRLRPIFMTVATMIVGMIPLIVEGGAGAAGNRSLAIGVVGGMSVGIVALLFVVPSFYIVFQNLHDRFHSTEEKEERENAQI